MLDKHKRSINYMRISLTDRCNLRCAYCRPDIAQMVEHSQILRYEEILRVAQCAVTLGITRFKITGGEPLVRKGAVDFITKLKQMDGVEQVTLTTNGTLLEKNLQQLCACGIYGINISLDTVDKDSYRKITGGGDLEAVINAIKAAAQTGLKCKINCVPLTNTSSNKSVKVDNLSLLNSNVKVADLSPSANQKNLLALVEFARSLKVPLRFIELMPLACNNSLSSYSGTEIREILSHASYELRPIKASLGNGPAVYYEATKNGHTQIIGFIEPLHGKFCASCNRVRLTSTGQLKPCLYSQSTLDLRQLLRSGIDALKKTEACTEIRKSHKAEHMDDIMVDALRKAIFDKPMGHHFEEKPATFNMNEIGG